MMSQQYWNILRIIKHSLDTSKALTCITHTRLSLPANPSREVDLLQQRKSAHELLSLRVRILPPIPTSHPRRRIMRRRIVAVILAIGKSGQGRENRRNRGRPHCAVGTQCSMNAREKDNRQQKRSAKMGRASKYIRCSTPLPRTHFRGASKASSLTFTPRNIHAVRADTTCCAICTLPCPSPKQSSLPSLHRTAPHPVAFRLLSQKASDGKLSSGLMSSGCGVRVWGSC